MQSEQEIKEIAMTELEEPPKKTKKPKATKAERPSKKKVTKKAKREKPPKTKKATKAKTKLSLDLNKPKGVSLKAGQAIKAKTDWTKHERRKLRPRGRKGLTAETVKKIKIALIRGMPGVQIAEKVGVTPSMISAIKHGLAWSKVTV